MLPRQYEVLILGRLHLLPLELLHHLLLVLLLFWRLHHLLYLLLRELLLHLLLRLLILLIDLLSPSLKFFKVISQFVRVYGLWLSIALIGGEVLHQILLKIVGDVG